MPAEFTALLSGDKVSLRTIRSEDLPIINTYCGCVDMIGESFTTFVRHEYYWAQRVKESGLWEQDKGTLLITDKSSTPVGLIWFFKGHASVPGFEIGYNLFAPEARGKGLGSEALLLFSAYLFESHPINRLQCNAIESNAASRKIAEKCGYRYEGMMREALFVRGEMHNLALYSLLRDELPSLKAIISALSEKIPVEKIVTKHQMGKEHE